MFTRTLKRARPITREAISINETIRAVTGNRNLRPVGTFCNYVDLPWGQANIPPSDAWTIAFTDGSGVPVATDNSDGTLTLGKGQAYEAYPTIDDADGTAVLGYSLNQNDPITIYNIAKNTDGAIGANHWIIAQRFWSLWIVTWEECPDS